jgi:UDP-N-acetylmuramoylalanine--D-glutamate ligase
VSGIVVVGLGVTGVAVVEFARANDAEVVVIEDRPGGDTFATRSARAVALGAVVLAAPREAEVAARVAAADLVVPSPGVHPDHVAIVAARRVGVPVRSEVDLAAERLLGRTPRPRFVAVSGTNGKTTVTTLIAEMLTHAGIACAAAGNIGRPLLDAVDDAVAVVVAEVSSFQLDLTTEAFAPDVAVLLNVAEDHLDWHGSTAAYAAAKARLFEHQSPDGVLVVNVDDPVARDLAARAPGRVVAVSATTGVSDPAAGGVGAPHDVVNAAAAAAAARELGADDAAIEATRREFVGLRHRVELVGEVAGVRYYDDSKATNPHATASALQAFPSVVLIAGGRNKALDLGVLRVQSRHVRAVVAIGEAADEVIHAFAGVAPVERASTMHDAVQLAADRAEAGDVVLLSPACASFDWYESYAERGDDFAREVSRLTEVRA